MDEDVFRALADGSRRQLLDGLFERDGQTMSELANTLPAMTRFGVAKHLRVLEEAGLVVTRRVGRSKLHYLNPVPIRQVHDRWISKYAEPWVRTLTVLKDRLEAESGSASPAGGARTHEVYLRATPERVRQELRALRRRVGHVAAWRRVTVDVTALGSVTRVVVVDHGARPLTDWAVALSAVKTLLETGEPLDLGVA